MDKLDQAIAALKIESKRLEGELRKVRSAIADLQGASNNGRGITARLSGRTMSAAARKRIVVAQIWSTLSWNRRLMKMENSFGPAGLE